MMTPEQRAARIEKLRAAASKGGKTTKKRHGRDHFVNAGKKGGKASWKTV